MHVETIHKHPLQIRPGYRRIGGHRRAPRGQVVRAMAQGATSQQIPTENLTKADLVQYLRSGCKSRDKWK